MVERECRRCGSPNSPLFVVRERNFDLILFDVLCLDCGFSWSEVLTADEYHEIVAYYEKDFVDAVKKHVTS